MKRPLHPVLITLLVLFLHSASVSQELMQLDKQQFSAQITTVKFWTYLSGDSAYRGYAEISDLIRSTLSRKGYLPEQVSYTPGPLKTPSEWEQTVISDLDSNEAFLIIILFPVKDSTNVGTPAVSHLHVVDPTTGTTIVTAPKFETGAETGYSWVYHSEMFLYKKGFPDQDGKYSPVYRKMNPREHPDPRESVAAQLKKLPARPSSGAESGATSSFSPYTARGEFALFGGWFMPSSMKVEQGDASFSGAGVYGLEVALGFSRNVDLVASFLRQVTKFDLQSSLSSRENGPVAISQNYILLGSNYNFRLNETWTLFLGGSLGGVNLVPKDTYYRDVWYFAISCQGGVKTYLLPWLGLRIQAQVCYQVHPEGAPFLYSRDYFYLPIDSYSNMAQFGAMGGIFFRAGAGHRK